MAYNSSKGPQQHGDIKYESDPLDTQIDFEDDFVAIKTNGQQRFIVSGSDVTVSNTAILLGTVRHNTQVLSTDFNVELGSYYLAVSGNASHITASLPAASVLGQGATLVFKDIQGVASTKNIVIAASGSETIDGNAQVKIQADWGAMTISGNGVDGWAIMGEK